MMEDKINLKKRFVDFIIIIAIIIIILALFIIFDSKETSSIAHVYIKNSEVLTIDLNGGDESFEFEHYTIELRNHKVGIVENDCPHNDCVKIGFSDSSNKPIICAYYQILIIVGDDIYDMVI